MGIEAGLIAAGWSSASAAVASGVITAVGTAAVGAVASKAMAPKTPDTAPAALTQADKPTQAEKAPDRQALLDKNAMAATTGALAGNSSTLLTGPQGVNPMSLSLGSSRLLGQ
ncbi:hypothetical protein D3C85_1467140 [compost metagenome]